MLSAPSRRYALIAGLAGGLAGLFKFPLLVPAAAICVASAAPLLALGALVATTLAGLAISTIAFGAFWRGVFQAQAQTGLSSIHYTGGLWAQTAWNLIPLAVPAAISVWNYKKARDLRQFRVFVVGAVASLALLLSLFKRGSYLNVVVAVEPPLVVLAACGWTWLLESRPLASARWTLGVMLACVLLGVAEVASLLTSPTDAGVFRRPLAASGPAWKLTDGQVGRQVTLISRCPIGAAYSGQPYLAFAARRRMPGNQPDQFIIDHAHADARFLAAAAGDRSRCP
jgi:hypothetical protein